MPGEPSTSRTPRTSRKVPRDEKNWTRKKLQARRYAPARPPAFPLKCNHKERKGGKASTYQCDKLSMQDVRRFHQAYYEKHDKMMQDSFILKYTKGQDPKRRRGKDKNRDKTMATKYFVKRTRKDTGTSDVQVCQKAFIHILGITKHRVQGVIKRHKATGKSPVENRGGDRRTKKYLLKNNAITAFISKFEPVESHYCRAKSTRKYLSSELSVRKMFRMYNAEHSRELQTKYDYFRHIFLTKFNISFNSPATDACSCCLSHREKIKVATGNEKEVLKTELHVHKLKAKAFYDILKTENPEHTYLSFDCQKNQPLPKVPDQAAYYSRQLYSYNFTICEGHSKATQNSESVTIFNWLESEHNKSSNEIVSAVYHKMCSLDLTGRTCLKLFADGASGQNKNSSMLYMLAYWLMTNAPPNITQVEIIFPVVGHSFLPADRVFGRIEQIIKKKATILTPKEYKDIFSTAGSVLTLSDDVKVLDFKSAATEVLKTTTDWHFQFKPSKRIILKRKKNFKTNPGILFKGEVHYRSDVGSFKSICKAGKNFTVFPREIPKCANIVKRKKLADVDNLLKTHFGDNWRELPNLNYYKKVLEAQYELENHVDAAILAVIENQEEELEDTCEESAELRI